MYAFAAKVIYDTDDNTMLNHFDSRNLNLYYNITILESFGKSRKGDIWLTISWNAVFLYYSTPMQSFWMNVFDDSSPIYPSLISCHTIPRDLSIFLTNLLKELPTPLSHPDAGCPSLRNFCCSFMGYPRIMTWPISKEIVNIWIPILTHPAFWWRSLFIQPFSRLHNRSFSILDCPLRLWWYHTYSTFS